MENNKENNYSPNKLEIPRIEKKLGDVRNSEKNYEEAIHHYKNSIMALKILFDEDATLNEDDSKASELIEDVGIPVHLNLAYCYLKLEDWKNVIFYCNRVLELKPENVKAIYRRCRAYLSLKDNIEILENLLLKDSEELKQVHLLYNELVSEIEKESEMVLANLAKKNFKKNKIEINNSEDISKVNKWKDFIFKIPQIGTSIILFGINSTIQLPLKIAVGTSKLIKNLVWDIPLNITRSVTNTFVVPPTRWILDKFNPFSK